MTVKTSSIEKRVVIMPEADDFLKSLPEILLREGYVSTYTRTARIMNDIVDFIYQLDDTPHYSLPLNKQSIYNQYASQIWVAFFRRKTSRRTTWYIFFEKTDDRYIVHHIANNWTEGQNIR